MSSSLGSTSSSRSAAALFNRSASFICRRISRRLAAFRAFSARSRAFFSSERRFSSSRAASALSSDSRPRYGAGLSGLPCFFIFLVRVGLEPRAIFLVQALDLLLGRREEVLDNLHDLVPGPLLFLAVGVEHALELAHLAQHIGQGLGLVFGLYGGREGLECGFEPVDLGLDFGITGGKIAMRGRIGRHSDRREVGADDGAGIGVVGHVQTSHERSMDSPARRISTTRSQLRRSLSDAPAKPLAKTPSNQSRCAGLTVSNGPPHDPSWSKNFRATIA